MVDEIGVPPVSEIASYGRTVSGAEVALMESILKGRSSGEPQAQYAHGAVIPPPIVWMLLDGMHSAGPAYYVSREIWKLQILAQLELEFAPVAPFRVGDTLYLTTKWLDSRATRSNPHRHLLSVQDTAFNQHGTQITQVKRLWLVQMLNQD